MEVVMTDTIVADDVLGKFARRQHDWFERVRKGSLDPEEVTQAVQSIIDRGKVTEMMEWKEVILSRKAESFHELSEIMYSDNWLIPAGARVKINDKWVKKFRLGMKRTFIPYVFEQEGKETRKGFFEFSLLDVESELSKPPEKSDQPAETPEWKEIKLLRPAKAYVGMTHDPDLVKDADYPFSSGICIEIGRVVIKKCRENSWLPFVPFRRGEYSGFLYVGDLEKSDWK